MATIDSRPVIDHIIATNGAPHPDDTPGATVVKIVEYTNIEGRQCWGIVFDYERLTPHRWGRYEIETPYVRRPQVIWLRDPQSRSGS